MKYITFLLFVVVTTGAVWAQSGAAIPQSLVIADDGTILVAGSATNTNGVMEYVVVGYNPDGTERGRVSKTLDAASPYIAKACATSGTNVVITGTGGDASSPQDIVTFLFQIDELVSNSDVPLAASGFTLDPAYPNPVGNSVANVGFTLASEADVRLAVHDISGKELRIVEEGRLAPGEYSRSIDTQGLTAGTYFVVLQTPKGSASKKLLVVQ